MGRAILPEAAIGLALLVLCGIALVVVGVAGAGLAVNNRFTQRRQRRSAQREQNARHTAQWQPRIRYERGFAVIDMVRVARWDTHEIIIESSDYEIIPEGDMLKIALAQLEADVQANQRNRQIL